MRSVRTGKFRELLDKLAPSVRALVEKNYLLWKQDTSHPGLNFEKVDDEDDMWSARVGRNYRAVCIKTKEPSGETCYVWFWIGEHDEYERLINS